MFKDVCLCVSAESRARCKTQQRKRMVEQVAEPGSISKMCTQQLSAHALNQSICGSEGALD